MFGQTQGFSWRNIVIIDLDNEGVYMTKKDYSTDLRKHLVKCNQLHAVRQSDPVLGNNLLELSRWQSERLGRTHSDLINNPRYSEAARYFFNELYGPMDFSKRDKDLERLYPLMVTVFPHESLQSISLMIELNALATELDCQMLKMLFSMSVSFVTMTEQQYVLAYLLCENYELRAYQLELIKRIGEITDKVVYKPFLFTLIQLARTPAQFAGFGDLQNFIERGFRIVRKMNGSERFFGTVYERELLILDRIYKRHSDPFNIHKGTSKN